MAGSWREIESEQRDIRERTVLGAAWLPGSKPWAAPRVNEQFWQDNGCTLREHTQINLNCVRVFWGLSADAGDHRPVGIAL
jgi:hypothetical protein